MTLRSTGYIADPPDVARFRNGFHLLAKRMGLSSSALPTSTTNRQFLPTSKGGPGLLNQHQTSSCTGYASAGAGTS